MFFVLIDAIFFNFSTESFELIQLVHSVESQLNVMIFIDQYNAAKK